LSISQSSWCVIAIKGCHRRAKEGTAGSRAHLLLQGRGGGVLLQHWEGGQPAMGARLLIGQQVPHQLPVAPPELGEGGRAPGLTGTSDKDTTPERPE